MNPAFDISHDVGSTTCVVSLSEDLDLAVVPELRTELEAALETGCTHIVLDLEHVTYADSSALGLLVWLNSRLGAANGKVVLAGANRDVSRILELSGLVDVAGSIGLSPSVGDAVEGLGLPEMSIEPLWHRKLDVVSDLDVLSGVREEISSWIAPLGFSESSLFDIKVALGEALANAVRHGCSSAGASEVGVAVTAFPDRVAIEVTDHGRGFNGEHISDGDLYAPSGRGIMFMRALMDHVDFETTPGGGTLVRLIKHRRGEAG